MKLRTLVYAFLYELLITHHVGGLMFVYLIGAGPGDPGLITCKGFDALSRADVIVYDYLASDILLNSARHDAEKIYVGKVAGNHALPQEEINALLVRKAKEGKIVARLKGGDPYIFGRGGEEGRALFDAGVPFAEVPGISSTIAGPAYAGIPLTDRTVASSVTIITGHEDPTKPDSVHNWDALAKSASTLVFVMGMKNLPDISKNLIKAGIDPKTPAALIHWGTMPHQRSLDSTIEDLPQAAIREGFTNPSVIVVGHVVSLRDKLNWNEARPLFGRTVVVTRSREQASEMVSMLMNLGAKVIQYPTISIEEMDDYDALDAAINNLDKYQWIIFTSVNGVQYFAKRLRHLGKDSRAFAHAKIAAIGPVTCKEVEKLGIIPDFVPETFVAESVAEGLCKFAIKGTNILIPRALESREVLPNVLREQGANVDIAPTYKTVLATGNKEELLEALEKDSVDCVTFASSSTVRNFMDNMPLDVLKKCKNLSFASIGPITSATLREYSFEPQVEPKDFTIPALLADMTKFFCPHVDMESPYYTSLLKLGKNKK